MEKVLDVAQYIFREYKYISGKVIEEMKLHLLLYLTQRESFAILDEPMFAEQFEGWKCGPVCCEVKNCYTEEGIYAEELNEISAKSICIVKNIILQYGCYEVWKLKEICNKELSWGNSRKGVSEGQSCSKRLSVDDIREDSKKVRLYDTIWDMYYDEFEEASNGR